MKPINHKKYKALVKVLNEFLSDSKDDTEQTINIKVQIATLKNIYHCYEVLLVELADCIREYELIHHRVERDILGPRLRNDKKNGNTKNDLYRATIRYIEASRTD